MGLVRSLLSLKKLDVQGVEIGTEWNGNKTAGPTSPCRNFRWEDMEISEKKDHICEQGKIFLSTSGHGFSFSDAMLAYVVSRKRSH